MEELDPADLYPVARGLDRGPYRIGVVAAHVAHRSQTKNSRSDQIPFGVSQVGQPS